MNANCLMGRCWRFIDLEVVVRMYLSRDHKGLKLFCCEVVDVHVAGVRMVLSEVIPMISVERNTGHSMSRIPRQFRKMTFVFWQF